MKFVLLILWSLRWGANPLEYVAVPVITPIDPLVRAEVLVYDLVPSGIEVTAPTGRAVLMWHGPAPAPGPPE